MTPQNTLEDTQIANTPKIGTLRKRLYLRWFNHIQPADSSSIPNHESFTNSTNTQNYHLSFHNHKQQHEL